MMTNQRTCWMLHPGLGIDLTTSPAVLREQEYLVTDSGRMWYLSLGLKHVLALSTPCFSPSHFRRLVLFCLVEERRCLLQF